MIYQYSSFHDKTKVGTNLKLAKFHTSSKHLVIPVVVYLAIEKELNTNRGKANVT